MPTNAQIIKNTITTDSVSHGLLTPYQAKKFLVQTFEATPFQQAIRHVTRTEKSGEIDKTGIGHRLLRPKVENTFDGVTASPTFGVVKYACEATRLDWDITNETLRQNIEGENMDDVVTNLMTKQVGVDSEDLLLNGEENATAAEAFSASTAYKVGDCVTEAGGLYRFRVNHAAGAWNAAEAERIGDAVDKVFLGQNDGVIKILGGSHIIDASGAKEMELEMFYRAVASMPTRFNDGTLRWMMSPTRAQQWELFLLNKVINAGGAVPESLYKSPVGIPSMGVPMMPDDTVILSNPKNFVQVNTYTLKIRKDETSVEAIRKDKKFYVIHFDFDAIIEEIEATAMITNLPALLTDLS